MKKVLVLASGLSARDVDSFPCKEEGWTIVVVNHGWMAYPNYDHWIHSSDFKGIKDPNVGSRKVPKYRPALDHFGGQKLCGYSITANAGYWVLKELKPDVIGFLGADMNYERNANGDTHIYGLGLDVKNGRPDPDKMVKNHGRSIEEVYGRLEEEATKLNCKLVNLSTVKDTRLPYTKASPESFDG